MSLKLSRKNTLCRSRSYSSISQTNTTLSSISSYRNNIFVKPWYDLLLKEQIGSSNIQISQKKQYIDTLKSTYGGRVWAIDVSSRSGAKIWMWTDNISSFIRLYSKIPSEKRHAYEIIPYNYPCRVVFDLDMYQYENATGKDCKEMVKSIRKYIILKFNIGECFSKIHVPSCCMFYS